MDAEVLAVRLNLEREDANEERSAAEREPGTVVGKLESLDVPPPDPLAEARFVEPCTFLLIATASYLAVRVVNWLIRSQEQGTLIDLRKQPVVISRIAGTPVGFLVVIDQKGEYSEHFIEARSESEFIDFVKGFFQARPLEKQPAEEPPAEKQG